MKVDELGEIWTDVGYDGWEPFTDRFQFEPDYDERARSAIREPAESVTLDLTQVFDGSPARFAAGAAAIDAAACRAFVWLLGNDDLIAMDWQHPSYHYSPAKHALSELGLRVPVFPDGDYYIHAPLDFRWGTFGHPWQQTLCVWGDELTATLGSELSTWLPVLRRGGRVASV